MVTAGFSEFSFGYALTDSLINTLAFPLGGAPVFPSLQQEGSTGGGYDVHLPAIPYPLFLQFKIPQVLSRHSSLCPPGYVAPYSREEMQSRYFRPLLLPLLEWFCSQIKQQTRKADTRLFTDLEGNTPQQIAKILAYVSQVHFGLTLALFDASDLSE